MVVMEDFTIDQFAGSTALILGSFASLLLVIWQSRCLCKCRIGISDECYIFDCSREPPPEEDDDEEKQIKDKDKKKDKKKDPKDKKDIKLIPPIEMDRVSHEDGPEPEPEPVIKP